MGKVVCCPIGPVPSALFDDFGMVRKTTNSDLEGEVVGSVLHDCLFQKTNQYTSEIL